MFLEKYKNLLFQNIKNQVSQWFETKIEKSIPNSEVYSFLHSIKGTSGTIQLGGLYQVASKLLESVNENDQKEWAQKELRDFLYELIGLAYEYEHFEEAETKKELPGSENAPLIQIIDDDVSMLILLKDVLEEQGWMVIAQSNPEKAVSQYYEFQPDCLILDVNLSGKNGFEIINQLKDHLSKQFVPVVVISMVNDRETRLNAYKLGADDFIEKPIDMEEFTLKIERHLERKRFFDQSVLMDELTKVYNRKFLKDVLQRNLNDHKRTRQPFTVAMVDIDYFKKINDHYGHLVGDKVLVAFASFLKENVRSSDTVFRYGGEEFVILFPRTKADAARETLTRLLNEFSKVIFEADNETFTVTFSGGVFQISSSEISMESALKSADQALYRAKENGRSRVESANMEIEEPAKRTLFISVIDDDAIIRTMLMKVIQSMVFDHVELDIEVFEDGLKFLQSERLRKPGEHFLILDGIMPVMDGLEVLQKVKNIRIENQLYVLMLTGRKSEEDISRALKLGADDYMTKPFSITELHARIHRLIQRMN